MEKGYGKKSAHKMDLEIKTESGQRTKEKSQPKSSSDNSSSDFISSELHFSFAKF